MEKLVQRWAEAYRAGESGTCREGITRSVRSQAWAENILFRHLEKMTWQWLDTWRTRVGSYPARFIHKK